MFIFHFSLPTFHYIFRFSLLISTAQLLSGEKGDNGTVGVKGNAGMVGVQGSRGVNGSEGADGAKGIPGENTQGPPGPAGPPGTETEKEVLMTMLTRAFTACTLCPIKFDLSFVQRILRPLMSLMSFKLKLKYPRNRIDVVCKPYKTLSGRVSPHS